MGQTAIAAFFRGYQNVRCVGSFINAHIEALPSAGHLESKVGSCNISEISAFKRRYRLAIHLLFLNVQVRKPTGKWGERRGSR